MKLVFHFVKMSYRCALFTLGSYTATHFSVGVGTGDVVAAGREARGIWIGPEPGGGSSGGVIVPAGAEQAYPSLGMGWAVRARYPEVWNVSRPCIARETPSTPCSTVPTTSRAASVRVWEVTSG